MAKEQSFTREELLDCGYGRMFGPGNAQLPVSNMLMMDRVVSMTDEGGAFSKGSIHAELDINPDLWFFDCHFPGDPVMPGCLGLDAMWQAVGFFLAWIGNPGHGRALGVGEVKFTGQILRSTQCRHGDLSIGHEARHQPQTGTGRCRWRAGGGWQGNLYGQGSAGWAVHQHQ